MSDILSAADYQQIQNLIHRYPKLLDQGDLDGVGQLFADATVWIQGQEEPIRSDAGRITGMFADFLQLYEGKPRTRHIIANVIIEPDGADHATASSTVVVFQQTPALPLQPIITGDYHDRFIRRNGRWQFLERRISNDLFGDLSAHGRYDYR